MESKEKIFKKITDEMLQTYIAKNHDYGNSFDHTCDMFGITAAVVRMYDKMQRISKLSVINKQLVKDEKMEDTLKDLANYCIMTLIYLKNNENK